MDHLFAGFHDELEKISEERSKLPAALAAGALGTGGVIAHAHHKKVLADRARLARKNKFLLPLAVAGTALTANNLRRIRRSLKARKGFEAAEESLRRAHRRSEEFDKLYDEQKRRARAYENVKKEEAMSKREAAEARIRRQREAFIRKPRA